jgi:hypothetical protein
MQSTASGRIAQGTLSQTNPPFLLHRIMRLWEADDGTILEETGRKAKISGYFIALDFWENSLYSSYTQPSHAFPVIR